MPARPVNRGALGAALFAAAVALAMPGLPAARAAVGVPAGVVPVPPDIGGTAAPSPVPGPGSPSARPAPAPTGTAPDVDAPSVADSRAGILRRTVAHSAGGTFEVVLGSLPAPGPGEVRTVRVEVEQGLPVDGDRFAAFVLTTLNDPRGWGHGGTMSFARTDSDAPITVLLASPDTSAQLCDDVDSGGELSCRNGPYAVLTYQRWVTGTAEYAGDLTAYRQYVVNHEVGHALGHGHEHCAGPGRPAPVMQQQTLGLKGCAPNSWPYP